MYELLLRTETLFLGLDVPVLLAIGIPALLIGLVLWLGGTRYSTAIIGLLGAVVGSFIGLLVSQWFDLHPWLSMLGGAVVLAVISILLRNILILVLAVLVFSAVSGAGYVAVMLDRIAPPQAEAQAQTQTQTQAQSGIPLQSFSSMDAAERLTYMNDISEEAQTFAERLKAMLENTWDALGSQGVMVVIAVVAGAVVGILLVWYIAKVIIALAYSVVGTATIFIGAQAALLGVGYPAASALDTHRVSLPIAFVTMTAIGWAWQLFSSRRKPKQEHEETKQADT